MKLKDDEQGQLMLEAAIVYPLVMVIFVFFLYLLLLCAQRAQVVSAAEQTMVYIKYICSGNYDIEKYDISNSSMELPVIDEASNLYIVYSRLFDTPKSRFDKLNNNSDGLNVNKIFNFYLKTPLLGNIDDDFTVKTEAHNYVLYTELDLEVSYSVKQVINFSFIGGEAMNHPKFTVKVKGIISDPTETIRNLQYVDYLLVRTGLDSKIAELIGEVKGWFGFGE